jgi:hypothetical protein
MEHAMVKDETGTPFCLCGYEPHIDGLWEAKGDVLSHVAEEKNRPATPHYPPQRYLFVDDG